MISIPVLSMVMFLVVIILAFFAMLEIRGGGGPSD